ncbi:hypothetical protein [Adlercreutzia caecimuris]|uniref:Uncharacterized protein n=1 Tax=Adlercreutzia caecimuris TaxID=671266 RepID=A0A4S4G7U8_9ACTN|nr:hypothetical protein [Adlercreutzia caecimuris]THG38895.1 hypothetical protein E5986_00955 [Adlercreutzia caecimuris]
MNRYSYTDSEKEINIVLASQDEQLKSISMPDSRRTEERITSSEALLGSLGYDLPGSITNPKSGSIVKQTLQGSMPIPSWEEVLEDALQNGADGLELQDLFTEEELQENSEAIRLLNEEYNQIHRLDEIDMTIAAVAGLLSAAVDILLVGIPQKTSEGMKAAPLSDYVRRHIENALTPEQVKRLERAAKVPYDAPVNKGFTRTQVEGLCPGMHRLYSLGHDPLLGFVVGVSDILTGRMTTIDKDGRIVVQAIERYASNVETSVVKALIKQIAHLFSDLTTPAGLPVPCMALFNLMQFGSIGDEDAVIADVVQGMYWEGYDFAHFCSMSIPVAVSEIFVRFAYILRRLSEGVSLKGAAALSVNREKNPKLATMLFIAHTSAAAINAGKVYFKKNPLAINYPQWVAFARYSYQQFKWIVLEKPDMRDKYVRGIINDELSTVYDEIDEILGGFDREIAAA